jgi:hypothetical protein
MFSHPFLITCSGEVMLQDMGMPLGWQSLSQEYTGPGVDPRFVPPAKEEVELWTRIAHLGPQVWRGKALAG